ncbi:Uncharacterised protein [Bordetella pertussis]|nr:Uncharacterised protein [Bordetella pertussis]
MFQRLAGLGVERRVIALHLLQRTAPVVDAGVHVQHVHAALDQRNGGQDAVAMQAVGIQGGRLVVGRHHERGAVLEQLEQQAVQDHRVGDVRDVELVETNQAVTASEAARHFVQRVLRALDLFQLAVHPAHEFVEMQARLAHHRHGGIEGIHQEALAAPHAAPQIHAARYVQAVEQFLQGVGAQGLEADPFIVVALQAFDGLQLRLVGLIPAFRQGVFVVFADVHVATGKSKTKGRIAQPAPGQAGKPRDLLAPGRLIRSSGYACRQPARLP